ncbi:MAG: TonB family protein [Candidatus Aminicenantaceae bacterium]
MKKAMKLIPLIFILILPFSCRKADQKLDLKLKFYKGINSAGIAKKSSVVTSYTFKPFFAGNIISVTESPDESSELKDVFHLEDVELLNETDLSWKASSGDKVFQIINVNGNDYSVFLTPNMNKETSKLRVEVFEGPKEQKEKNLIDAEIILPRDNIAVIGFSDSKKIPYFLSFRVTSGVLGEVVGGGLIASIRAIDPVCGKKIGKGAGFEKENRAVASYEYKGETFLFCSEECLAKFKENPEKYIKEEMEMVEPEEQLIPAKGNIKPSKLIHKVDPVYPETARQARISGIVILEATTDTKGNVIKVKVLRPVHPELDKAAIDAIKQWKYEPIIIKGKPVGVTFTVTVRFNLK